jgi:hypothetical protein
MQTPIAITDAPFISTSLLLPVNRDCRGLLHVLLFASYGGPLQDIVSYELTLRAGLDTDSPKSERLGYRRTNAHCRFRG